jgi:hypothetical protein
LGEWLLKAATELNSGRRRDCLVKLAELLGVHVDTVRRWVRGDREVPRAEVLAIKSLLEVRSLRFKLSVVRSALNGIEDEGARDSG